VVELKALPGMIRKAGAASSRFWEVDYCRGVAVVMMILFHAAFDMWYLGVLDIQVQSGPWKILAVCTASLFLLIVGLSLSISSARARKTLHRREFILKYLRRGVGIMGLGLLLTLVTMAMVPTEPILFGILHLIGLSVMLAPLYVRYTWANFVAGLAVIAVGWGIRGFYGPIWLIWLGVHPQGFASLDYTPIFPWLGVVLLGVWLGHLLYPGGMRRATLPVPDMPAREIMCFAGRHSLVIYLIHQPILILVISILWSPGRIPII